MAHSNSGPGGRRYAPYAFTEHGVTMLFSMPRSPGQWSTATRPSAIA